MVLKNWLKRFVPGDPVSKVCDTQNYNRIANVLEDLEVVGQNGIVANITKPTNAEGRGWIISVDGAQILNSRNSGGSTMWKITVDEDDGRVEVEGGDVYDGTKRTAVPSGLAGSATGACYVIWRKRDSGRAFSLVTQLGTIGYQFRVLGRIIVGDNGKYAAEQWVHDPIELVSGELPGSGEATAKVLGGSDENAATDSWEWGEVDGNGLPTYPVYNPTRFFWQPSEATLWMFRRTETYNASGLLVSVSREVRTAVFTAVSEMP